MTIEVGTQNSRTNTTITTDAMESLMSSESAVAEKPLNNTVEVVPESEPTTEELRDTPEEMRSPSPQERISEASPSVYHTPEVFSSPMPVRDLDLSKVRSALSEFNSALKEEEKEFFGQLSAAQTENTKLRQHLAVVEELKETNNNLKKSVEAAKLMMSKLRTESTSRIRSLSENLVNKDVEIAKLQAEYRVMNESKESEMAMMKNLLETHEQEVKKLRAEARDSSESLNAQEAELAHLKREFETLKAAFESIKEEKDEIEQGHEEAKEKWKKLVITMKSEYDNFRASFDHLKASKKAMEESYAAEKAIIEQEAMKLRSENGSLTAAMDSLKICKEVSENELREAKQSWEKTKEEMESEMSRLRVENGTLGMYNDEVNDKINKMHTEFEDKVKERVEPHEKKVSSLMDEISDLKADMHTLKIAKDTVELEMANLKEHIEELEAERGGLKEIQQEHAALQETLAALKEAHSAIQGNLDEMTSLHDAKVTECEGLKSELAKMHDLQTALESEKADLLERLETLKTEHLALIKEKAGVEERLAAMESDNEAMSETHAAVSAELDDVRAKLIAVQEEKEATEKEVVSLKGFIEELEAKHGDLKTTLEAVKSNHQEEKDKFEKKIAKLTKAVETKKEALSLGLTKYLAELKAKEKAEKEIEALKITSETEITALKSQVQENEESIKKHLADLEEAKNTIANLEEEMKTKSAEFDEATSSKVAALAEDMKAKVAELEEEMKAREQAHAKALAKANAEHEVALKAKLEAEDKIAEMEKLVAKTEAGTLSAKCQSDRLREELQESTAQVESLTEELQDTKSKLDASQADSKALNEALKLAEQTTKKAREEAEDLKHQVSTLNKSVAKKIAAITALESKCETLKNTIDVSASSGMESEQKLEYFRQMVASKENELELIKNRCASLQSTLDEADGKLQDKTKLEKTVEEAENKITEFSILVQKKNKEIQSLQERCEKLQISLKKAETLYLDGVESIKTEAERKQREALEEATDRVYVLNGLLTKKEEELKALKESYQKLESGEAGEAKGSEEFKVLTSKINFLDEMVSSKDSELTLIRTRCEELQQTVETMKEAHQKQVSLIKDEADKKVSRERMEKEMELEALNKEIAQKRSKLKSLDAGDQDEFEVVLDNGDHKEEIEVLKKRCNHLEQELEQAHGKSSTLEAAMKAGTSEEAAEQWKSRCSELEATLDQMRKQYEEEFERRKEAEQVFATLSQKPSDEKPENCRPPRGVFGRSRPTPELSEAKKPSRWLGLRGRKKRDDFSVRSYNATEDYAQIAEQRSGSPSKYRAQYSPRRIAKITPRPRSIAEGVPPTAISTDREQVMAQIPGHIKSNFFEVGIYKQRLQNSYLPVLCLSPFDVPPGPIRDDWLSKFDGTSKVLSLGVYFLGKDGEEEGSYGTIPWFSFVPYEKAVQRGLDQIPKPIADKINAGEDLTHEEQQVCDGFEELVKMAALDRVERKHPLQSQEGEVPQTIVTDSSNEDDLVSEMGI